MSRKRKISVEEKIELVRDYLENRVSQSEAARRGGVSRDTICQWARNYETDGAGAFLAEKDRAYSPELKRQAVEAYLRGEGSQEEICKSYKIRDKKRSESCALPGLLDNKKAVKTE